MPRAVQRCSIIIYAIWSLVRGHCFQGTCKCGISRFFCEVKFSMCRSFCDNRHHRPRSRSVYGLPKLEFTFDFVLLDSHDYAGVAENCWISAFQRCQALWQRTVIFSFHSSFIPFWLRTILPMGNGVIHKSVLWADGGESFYGKEKCVAWVTNVPKYMNNKSITSTQICIHVNVSSWLSYYVII